MAALTTPTTAAVVYVVEAAHWYDIAPDVSVLDGDDAGFESTWGSHSGHGASDHPWHPAGHLCD